MIHSEAAHEDRERRWRELTKNDGRPIDPMYGFRYRRNNVSIYVHPDDYMYAIVEDGSVLRVVAVEDGWVEVMDDGTAPVAGGRKFPMCEPG